MATNKKQSPTKPEIQRKPQKEETNLIDPMQKSGFPVVGIGASAGGLKALQNFFETLPDDTGMAFVVITHLAPEHESHLAEILQNRTKMTVRQVIGKVDVEPNHVYVIPPNRELFIADSHLDVKSFEVERGLRTPIDYFFRSLATVHHGAIAIVLSGGGTDGAVGIKTIKEEGGLLMVQHPDEAEYDSMPRAAIATGLVDVVLGVRELAQKLMDYIRYTPQIPNDPELLSKEQQETIQRILAQVNIRTGHDFGQYKRSTILRRIKRRMQINGHETLESYLVYLHQNKKEAGAMFNDLLIGVTNFFRDSEAWRALAEQVIPALFESKQSRDPIRAWTIGCSTGEEAYSLAMLFAEYCDRLDIVDQPVQIFASDLDEAALANARQGLYPAAIEADVSRERLDRFFQQQDSHYRVKRQLRDMVLFANHNVLSDPPFSRLDLIACRNLLIYLQPEMQKNVFEIFHYALNPGGYIFLGSVESAESVRGLFQVMDKEHRIYQVRSWRGDHKHIPLMPSSVRLPKASRVGGQPRRTSHPREELSSLEAQHQKTLELNSPPSILIDQDYQILHLSETAGRYLLQPKGVVTTNLLKQVRPELHLELRAALLHAFSTGKAVLSKPIAVVFNGHPQYVTISVRPRPGKTGQDTGTEKQALVFFLEDESPGPDVEGQAATVNHGDDRNKAMIAQLEADVTYLREQLQTFTEEYESSNEELKASNEELQSINEEYRSATEELETSKEELQSVNEELQTVNLELKSKLDEISRAHIDLENLMSVTEVALLILDRNLTIKRYTAGMEEIFNLLPSDQGRPISHLTNKLGYTQIVKDAERVLRELTPVEREVSTSEGRWFLVRMRPYRADEDRIDGVVIGVVDITAIKEAERTQQNYESFYALFHSNPIPTLLTRLEDGTVLNVNHAFLNYMGMQREDVVGHTMQEFGLGLDITSKDRASLTAQLLKDGQVRNFEETLTLPSGQVKNVLTSIQYLVIENTDAIISTFIDITERVQAEQQIRQLTIDLTTAEQKERYRISQMLHDDLQQRIFAVKMQLENLQEALERKDSQAVDVEFDKLEEWLMEAINITRQLSTDLGPLSLKGERLVEVILWLSSQMKKQYGLEVELDAGDIRVNLDDNLQLILFHAVRELLFNVVKHAGVQKAKVILRQVNKNSVQITVIDKGKGFEPEVALAEDDNAGYGLTSMKHRLELFGCTLDLKSDPGVGTRVRIGVPLKGSGSPS